MGPAIRAHVSQLHHIFFLEPCDEAQKPGLPDGRIWNDESFDTRRGNGRERINTHIGICAKGKVSGKLLMSTELVPAG